MMEADPNESMCGWRNTWLPIWMLLCRQEVASIGTRLVMKC